MFIIGTEGMYFDIYGACDSWSQGREFKSRAAELNCSVL